LVDRPDKVGRIQILAVHLKKARLAADVDPEKIAALTAGFAGADLANLVNEAALLATRRGAEAVHLEDFTNAIERIVAGLEKRNRVLNPRERQVIAYHELGHAMVAIALPGMDPVHKISIIPRGIGALGYTIQRPTEDRYLMTREELENKMSVLLGGRAAEWVVFGHLSTGAADDLAKVTDIARSMVMRFGMDPKLGHVAYEKERTSFLGNAAVPVAERSYSDDTAKEIDEAVRVVVARAFDRATEILGRHRELLDRSAARLLEKETMIESDLEQIRAQMGGAVREGPGTPQVGHAPPAGREAAQPATETMRQRLP
jgi:cell division protease FtsH